MTHRCHFVDAVFALLRHGAGDKTSSCIDDLDWSAVEWDRVVAFASAHLVLPALAGPAVALAELHDIPDDFVSFAVSMRDANRARNLRMLEALTEAAHSLNGIGIAPAVLKGGAFLAEHGDEAASQRFMSDLDILVPEDKLAPCVAALAELGYNAATDVYDPARDAHYPPLISPCGEFTVEVHTRIFGLGDFGLPAEAVLRDAQPAAGFAGGLLVPSLVHRMVHVLAHSQLHNRNHMKYRLVLKDFLDIAALSARSGATSFDWDAVEAQFTNPADRGKAMALATAWQLEMAPDQLTDGPPASQLTWAERALGRLRRTPTRARLDAVIDTIRVEVLRMSDEAGHVSHRLAQLRSPRLLAAAASSYRHKLRQRLWG